MELHRKRYRLCPSNATLEKEGEHVVIGAAVKYEGSSTFHPASLALKAQSDDESIRLRLQGTLSPPALTNEPHDSSNERSQRSFDVLSRWSESSAAPAQKAFTWKASDNWESRRRQQVLYESEKEAIVQKFPTWKQLRDA